MSKSVRSQVELPAGVPEVVALRTSQRWVQLRGERLQDGSRLAQRQQRPDGVVDLAISRELPGGVPGFLERFLPKDGRVVQHESWGALADDGAVRGTWSVDVPGAPASIGGTSSLAPSGTGSVQVIEGTVKVSVPLIGGKAESFLVDVVARLMAKEGELLVEALGG